MEHFLSVFKRLSIRQRLKLFAAAGFLVAGLGSLAMSLALYASNLPVAGPPPDEKTELSDSAEAELAGKPSVPTITIDISGGVEHPGVYHLASGSRVADAVAAAGQFSDQANMLEVMEKLNLAEKLEDSQKVFIPLTGMKMPTAEKQEPAKTTESKKKASPKSTAKKTALPKKSNGNFYDFSTFLWKINKNIYHFDIYLHLNTTAFFTRIRKISINS